MTGLQRAALAPTLTDVVTASAQRIAWTLLFAFAAAKLLLHLLIGEGYGYFRDEFYYLACSEHLDWGYVDHPPLSIFLLWLGRGLLGDSVMAIRFWPALAGAASIVLTGWMAARLGGGRYAQALAMTAALIAPIYLGAGGYYSMNSYDLLIWTGAAALLIRIIQEDRPRLWVALGFLLGLGLLNKISVLWLGFGILIGLLVTPLRRSLRTPWPWIGGAVAVLLFLPHLIWQVAHGWPTIEFIRNATGNKMISVSPIQFLAGQVRVMHPLNLPVWLAGLYFLLAGRGSRFRILGLVYAVVFLILVLSGSSRSGYLAPAYTPLFAAGAVLIGGFVGRRGGRVLGAALLAILLLGGAVMAPLALPILPVETYIAYSQTLGVAPSTAERKELRELPQHFADMHGWSELIDELTRIYEELSPQDRQIASFFVFNYGEAGAIDLLGRERGLPKAASGHNNYWLWGPRGYSGEVLIIVGDSREDHLQAFREVEQVGTTDCRYCMPYEDGQPIWLARGLKIPLEQIWPQLKHFD